jgi:hypothetical protein
VKFSLAPSHAAEVFAQRGNEMPQKNKQLNLGWMTRVIDCVAKRIAASNSRLTNSGYPNSSACLTCFDEVPVSIPRKLSVPTLDISSEFDELGCAEIRRDVIEEIAAIQSVLAGADIRMGNSDWLFNEAYLYMEEILSKSFSQRNERTFS